MKELELEIDKYIEEHFKEYKELIKKLTSIPAPSGNEEKRVEFLLDLLKKLGFSCHSDDAMNVIIDSFYIKGQKTFLFMAHIDTVFPDTEELTVVEEDGCIKGPGVGDDTTNVAAIITTLMYIKSVKGESARSILFVLNSCEEGLGNLKGSKKIMEDYQEDICAMISFDGNYKYVCNKAVGSNRYQIDIATVGGHSYGDFGNENAIYYMSKLICKLYKIDTSKLNGKNTYNVGTIYGGTSVNTIAQDARILFEFRSDNDASREILEKEFDKILEDFKKKYQEIKINCTLVGQRPTGKNVDEIRLEEMTKKAQNIIRFATGYKAKTTSASTDCNIPLSKGVPAICYGSYLGGGQHTREEYVDILSLKGGLKIVMMSIMTEFSGKSIDVLL